LPWAGDEINILESMPFFFSNQTEIIVGFVINTQKQGQIRTRKTKTHT
jgi:hypothetical protein